MGSTNSDNPAIPRIFNFPSITYSVANAATVAAATAGLSTIHKTETSCEVPRWPCISTLTAPSPPSECGGLNIGKGAVNRSRYDADTRAVIHETSGNA